MPKRNPKAATARGGTGSAQPGHFVPRHKVSKSGNLHQLPRAPPRPPARPAAPHQKISRRAPTERPIETRAQCGETEELERSVETAEIFASLLNPLD